MLRSFSTSSLPFGMLLKPLSWVTAGPQSAAYAAALGLVAIQVGIGIIMKASQSGGTYTFSPSASVTISEFLKMCLSLWFFYRECRQRVADGIRPSTRGGGSGYSSLAGSDLPTTERSSMEEKERSDGVEVPGDVAPKAKILPHLDVRTYWSYIRGEVTENVRYGFCNLALFYVLINNSIFVSYKLADPGTIQLTKAGVTFITALVMIVTLNAKVSKIQWIAIIIQVCGLMVTQYNPETGATYSFGTYFLLIFQVFLSASSGVYNQALLKSDESSLHADNMILYAAGSVVNLMVHIMLSMFKEDEPGFFEGYNSFGAIMVIVSNVFIGLAITAVYRYADAVIKCFATAFATAILLYISPILFGTSLSFLVIPGTIVVFIASWLYMDNPPPKDPNAPPPSSEGKSSWQVLQQWGKSVLFVSTLFTVVVSVFLTMFASTLGDINVGKGEPSTPKTPTHPSTKGEILISPFNNTLAMVRWNSGRPERIPMIRKYEPFFHSIHISMPDSMPNQTEKYHNITNDQYEDAFLIYQQVARTMQLALDTQPDVEGLLYYHFDAWIDPLAWASSDFENIWYPSVVDARESAFGGPQFTCMNDSSKYNWWGWARNYHQDALSAIAAINDDRPPFRRDQFCLGWSDIYYVPRRFFADFITLSEIFVRFTVMHEVAIPTMLHVIDETRRTNRFMPVLDRFGDCWGSCCASGPKAEDVTWARCGHKLDYRNEPVVNAFYDKLDGQAAMLGTKGEVIGGP